MNHCAAQHDFLAKNPDFMAFAQTGLTATSTSWPKDDPPRGNIWTLDTDAPTRALVISSTVYEVPGE
jgi:hypothetical protein